MSTGPNRIFTPFTTELVQTLKIGDRVLISGTFYTARDAAHQRLFQLIDSRQKLPFEIRGQIIYYVGPTPAPPGEVIGSAGPTTASRMDRFTPALLALGLKGTIGKGGRSPEVVEGMRRPRAGYFG